MRKITLLIASMVAAVPLAVFCMSCTPQKAETPAAHSHIWGEWQTKSEASCHSLGERVRYCLIDNTHSQSENTPYMHNFGVDNTCADCGEAMRYSRGLEYDVSEDGFCTVTGIGSCKDREIIIPCYYQGLPVRAIGESSFENSDITGVVMPDTMYAIGTNAFSRCTGLSRLEIPDSVAQIGANCFKGCTNLESVELGKSAEVIGEYAFSDCYNLKSVVLSSGVERVEDYAFYYCTSLYSAVIGEGAEYIGQYTFGNCYNLRYVVFAGGGQWAVSRNSSITNAKNSDISDMAENARNFTGAYSAWYWKKLQ